jgi:secondary thiamine-phosphate synthase enzyme
MSSIVQRLITLKPYPRGFHLITQEVLRHLPEIRECQAGLLHVFIQHTSASLTLNENADPDVRADFEAHFNRLAPDGSAHFSHTVEGPDDMAAHIKAALLGASVSMPVTNGSPSLGTWQGLYLCEHRNQGGPRRLMLTLIRG